MALGHRSLSAFYRQFGEQLVAGLPFAEAVRASQGTGMAPDILTAMAGAIEAGGTIEQAFQAAAGPIPLADRQVLTAAAQAGRMPQTLASLSARHDQLGAIQLRLALACAYPLLVLHAGIVLLPLLRMVDWEKGFLWNAAIYARDIATGAIPLWTMIVVTCILIRRENRAVFVIGTRLPFVSAYLRAQGLSDFAFSLAQYLGAGIHLDRAWALAGATARRPELRDAAKQIEAANARGQPPGGLLPTLPCFPADFVAFYRTGESSGQLEQNLHHVAGQYQDRASRGLTLAAMFYPALLFAGVALVVAINVLRFYGAYFDRLGKLAT